MAALIETGTARVLVQAGRPSGTDFVPTKALMDSWQILLTTRELIDPNAEGDPNRGDYEPPLTYVACSSPVFGLMTPGFHIRVTEIDRKVAGSDLEVVVDWAICAP